MVSGILTNRALESKVWGPYAYVVFGQRMPVTACSTTQPGTWQLSRTSDARMILAVELLSQLLAEIARCFGLALGFSRMQTRGPNKEGIDQGQVRDEVLIGQ